MLLYADDTVIYNSNKSGSDVERVLNTEVGYIVKWFDKKNLILNIKKGKTEFVLYRSSKKLSTQADISIKINNTVINEVTTYKYLGVSLDNHLSPQNYVRDMYKKASRHVKMLLIRPLLLSTTTIGLPKGASEKLQSVQQKASQVIAMNGVTPNWDSIELTCKPRTSVVSKILNNLAPKIFEDIFQLMDHGKNTRGNNSILKLPKARTEP